MWLPEYNFGVDDQQLGGLVGVSFGTKKQAGDFQLDLIYWYLEDLAWVANWTDADTYVTGMTGSTGIELNWRSMLTDSIRLAWRSTPRCSSATRFRGATTTTAGRQPSSTSTSTSNSVAESASGCTRRKTS